MSNIQDSYDQDKVREELQRMQIRELDDMYCLNSSQVRGDSGKIKGAITSALPLLTHKQDRQR